MVRCVDGIKGLFQNEAGVMRPCRPQGARQHAVASQTRTFAVSRLTEGDALRRKQGGGGMRTTQGGGRSWYVSTLLICLPWFLSIGDEKVQCCLAVGERLLSPCITLSLSVLLSICFCPSLIATCTPHFLSLFLTTSLHLSSQVSLSLIPLIPSSSHPSP